MSSKLKKVNPKPDFIALEHDILEKWDKNKVFKKLVDKSKFNIESYRYEISLYPIDVKYHYIL